MKFPTEFIVIGSVVFVIGMLYLGGSILSPLDRAAGNRRARIRFTMMDFGGLFFLVQLPLALVRNLSTGQDRPLPNAGFNGQDVLFVLGLIVALVIWYKGVTTFSQAGIDSNKERAWLVFFVLPVAFLGIYAVVPIFFVLIAMLSERPGTLWTNQSVLLRPQFMMLLTVEIALFVAIFVARRMSRTIAADAIHRHEIDEPSAR